MKQNGRALYRRIKALETRAQDVKSDSDEWAWVEDLPMEQLDRILEEGRQELLDSGELALTADGVVCVPTGVKDPDGMLAAIARMSNDQARWARWTIKYISLKE